MTIFTSAVLAILAPVAALAALAALIILQMHCWCTRVSSNCTGAWRGRSARVVLTVIATLCTGGSAFVAANAVAASAAAVAVKAMRAAMYRLCVGRIHEDLPICQMHTGGMVYCAQS